MLSRTLFAGLLVVVLACSPLMAFAAVSSTAASPLSNISTLPQAGYERTFYYVPSAAAKKDFLAHISQIDVFAPQAYAVSSDGTAVTGSVDQTLLDAAAANHVAVMPLVTNGSFSRAGVERFLDNPTTQASVISDLVTIGHLHGYVGWQIDFEQIDALYRDELSAFVKRFADAMRANGLMSSVAVIAQVSENESDYPRSLWTNVIGVYDYAALGAAVDEVSVMSYDDPNSTGPIAEYSWFTNVIGYALSTIPANKISLGLGLYYWQWNDKTGKRVGIGGNEGIQNAFKIHYVTQKYSIAQQAPYLTYTSRGVPYTIWFENAESIKQKLSLIALKKLRGFSAWSLGLEVPSVWTVIPSAKAW